MTQRLSVLSFKFYQYSTLPNKVLLCTGYRVKLNLDFKKFGFRFGYLDILIWDVSSGTLI